MERSGKKNVSIHQKHPTVRERNRREESNMQRRQRSLYRSLVALGLYPYVSVVQFHFVTFPPQNCPVLNPPCLPVSCALPSQRPSSICTISSSLPPSLLPSLPQGAWRVRLLYRQKHRRKRPPRRILSTTLTTLCSSLPPSDARAVATTRDRGRQSGGKVDWRGIFRSRHT